MSFGIVSGSGFIKKTLSDVVEELETNIRAKFGTDVELGNDSVFNKLIGCFAEPIADLWEVGENLYNGNDPNKAGGDQQDQLVQINGLTRKANTPSTVHLIITGSDGSAVPSNLQVKSTINNSIWYSTGSATLDKANSVAISCSVSEPVTIPYAYTITINGHPNIFSSVGGNTSYDIATALVSQMVTSSDSALIQVTQNSSSILISGAIDNYTLLPTPFSYTNSTHINLLGVGNLYQFTSLSDGPVSAVSHSVTNLLNAPGNIYSADNPIDAVVGAYEENDEELRTRRNSSLFGMGSSTPGSIKAKILALPGVTQVNVTQNTSDVVDSNGLLPHSIHVVALGGNSTSIAKILHENLTAGVMMNGSTTINVVDPLDGITYPITFSRPTEKKVWVSVTFSKDLESTFPQNGISSMTTAILNYGLTLTPGIDLFPSKIIGALTNSSITGVGDLIIQIAEDNSGAPGTYQSTKLAIASSEYVTFEAAHITITEV